MAEGLVLRLFVGEIPPDAGLGCHASSTGLVQTTASTSLCTCPLGTGLQRRRLHNHIALRPFLQNCRTRSVRVLSGSRDKCESESGQVCLLTLSCCLAAAVAAACTPEVSLVETINVFSSVSNSRCRQDCPRSLFAPTSLKYHCLEMLVQGYCSLRPCLGSTSNASEHVFACPGLVSLQKRWCTRSV